MGDELEFDGKKYISSRQLSESSQYTSDYISRLCREGKIDGKLIGRSWFVNPDSLNKHKKQENYSASDIPDISIDEVKEKTFEDKIYDKLPTSSDLPRERDNREESLFLEYNVPINKNTPPDSSRGASGCFC